MERKLISWRLNIETWVLRGGGRRGGEWRGGGEDGKGGGKREEENFHIENFVIDCT